MLKRARAAWSRYFPPKATLTDLEVLSLFLDPRTKSLEHWKYDEVTLLGATGRARTLLRRELAEVQHDDIREDLRPDAKKRAVYEEDTDDMTGQKTKVDASFFNAQGTSENQDPVDEYAAIRPIKAYEDPLLWWRKKEEEIRFKPIAFVARKYLGMMGSTTMVEQTFSGSGFIADQRRGAMLPQTVSAQTFVWRNKDFIDADSIIAALATFKPYAKGNSGGEK